MLVRNESVDGSVCPLSHVVVPLSSVKEYALVGEVAWMMLTVSVDTIEFVTMVVTAFEAAAPASMAEDPRLTA